VSIILVSGQDNDQYAKEISDGLFTPIKPLTTPALSPLPTLVQIVNYTILQYSGTYKNLEAGISCYDATGTQIAASLNFYKDGTTLPANYQTNFGMVVLNYHYNRYNDILALLEGDGSKWVNTGGGVPDNWCIEVPRWS
jgi:hypothetical protein